MMIGCGSAPQEFVSTLALKPRLGSMTNIPDGKTSHTRRNVRP